MTPKLNRYNTGYDFKENVKTNEDDTDLDIEMAKGTIDEIQTIINEMRTFKSVAEKFAATIDFLFPNESIDLKKIIKTVDQKSQKEMSYQKNLLAQLKQKV